MKMTLQDDGSSSCDRLNCGSCRVGEHRLHDLLPGDTLVDSDGRPLCIGCGRINEAGGNHEFCRPVIAANIAERFGMIDGAHHKQWVIDQMLRALLENKYENWVQEMNSDPDYEEWDAGIAP